MNIPDSSEYYEKTDYHTLTHTANDIQGNIHNVNITNYDMRPDTTTCNSRMEEQYSTYDYNFKSKNGLNSSPSHGGHGSHGGISPSSKPKKKLHRNISCDADLNSTYETKIKNLYDKDNSRMNSQINPIESFSDKSFINNNTSSNINVEFSFDKPKSKKTKSTSLDSDLISQFGPLNMEEKKISGTIITKYYTRNVSLMLYYLNINSTLGEGASL